MAESGEGQVIRTTEADKDVRTYQVVGNSLLERIRKGEFRAAGKLPTERELAEIYGVGRAVIRDALVMLEVKGLIQSRQGSGIYITRRAYEIKPSDAGEALRENPWDSLPPSGPLDFLQAEQWLACQLVRMAATIASEDDLLDIEQAAEDCRLAPSAESRDYLEAAFRMTLARAVRNPELINLVHQLAQRRNNSPLWRDFQAPLAEFKADRWSAERTRIVDALRRRDPDAAYVAMWLYTDAINTYLLSQNPVVDDGTARPGPRQRRS